MKIDYPVEYPAFAVSQPFGEFVVAAIPARVLLSTAFSDRLKAELQPDGSYRLDGSQRAVSDIRLPLIGKFIDAPAAGFPNSIILAANYQEKDGLMPGDDEEGLGQGQEDAGEKKKWSFIREANSVSGKLIIPTDEKLVAIIDGQHRLFGFKHTSVPERLDMPLLCSIYFELPKPYQAFLFATINSNQRPVNKSQTYELFGYNVEDEPPDKWTPEKLSVFLTRKLNVESDSPFRDHILVPAENDFTKPRTEIIREGGWIISTAAVVEGIVRLISSNPKRDAYEMHGSLEYRGGNRSSLKDLAPSGPPLRPLYIAGNDELIYTGIKNFFMAVDVLFWSKATRDSYIRKTVGIQALFDVARLIFIAAVSEKNFSVPYFEEKLQPASRIDFADSFFQTSGTGRQRIRTSIELSLNSITLNDIKEEQRPYYNRLISSRSSGTIELIGVAVSPNVKAAFSTIQSPVGMLNMDYAANNVRNIERIREIIATWAEVSTSPQAKSNKQRNELKLLGFAYGSTLTDLGRITLTAKNAPEVARLWCSWILRTPDDQLKNINPKLVTARSVFNKFWQLSEEVRGYFLDHAEHPTSMERTVLQMIELLSNTTATAPTFSLKEIRESTVLLRDFDSLPQTARQAIDEYLENKGARGWDFPDRTIVPLAWQDARSKYGEL